MMKLFEKLVYVMEKTRRIKEETAPSNMIFTIQTMTKNSMSKVFFESATWIESEAAEALLEQGIIQRIVSENDGKYALTFRGIAQCVYMKYGISHERQFLRFLELLDQKFNTAEQGRLSWKEKLACLSLIILASTSTSSAVRLNSQANKAVLTEVFQKILNYLKEYDLIQKEAKLKTVSRDETPVSALMSRLNALPRKTNHYYFGKNSEYFLDIEKNGQIIEKRVSFLLKKIFESYSPDFSYQEMYMRLAEISHVYYPRFQARSVDTTVVFGILRKLKTFMDSEVLQLPLKTEVPSTLKN